MRFLPLLSVLVVAASTFACEADYRWSAPPSNASYPYPDASPSAALATSRTDGGTTGSACHVAIDRWKELLVIDRSVLESTEARNDVPGAAFSFRSRVEEIAGHPADGGASFTVAWLESWKTTTSVDGDAAPVTPRAGVEPLLVAPWRALGAAGAATMDRVPFRLIAIANRLDLRADERGCIDDAGELRFVYTAVDPASRAALAMNVIVEMPYPATRSPRAWAERWHALATMPFDQGYVDALAALVRLVVHDADPHRTRVRTNEVALGEASGLPWEMREFVRTDEGGASHLVPVALASTPRDGADGTTALRAWATDHASALASGAADELPLSLRAGAASIPNRAFRWTLGGGVSEAARRTFSQATCNGCHGGERPADSLAFQHLAPSDAPNAGYYAGQSATGATHVSTYLNDEASGGRDELGRRAASMERLLCNDCEAPPAVDAHDAGASPDYAGAPSCR